MLGGGGARGAAHVGVLKVLEELRIPIDCIAGTSMGSVVGGLYASGMDAEEIEREIRAMNWDDLFHDDPTRKDRSFRRKRDDDLYAFKAKIGVHEGQIKIPLAYIRGQKFDLMLNRLTLPVVGIDDFDRLPVPYRAIGDRSGDRQRGRACPGQSGQGDSRQSGGAGRVRPGRNRWSPAGGWWSGQQRARERRAQHVCRCPHRRRRGERAVQARRDQQRSGCHRTAHQLSVHAQYRAAAEHFGAQ